MPISAQLTSQIPIVIPIHVFGTEITGQDFMEATETRMVGPKEAVIVLTHRMAPLQQITIRNVATGAEATARIIGQVGGSPDARLHGIALLDPAVNLWTVSFPPAPAPKSPRAPLPLECSACKGQEQAALSRIERDVFHAGGTLSRHCPRCGETTLWRLAAAAPPAAAPGSAGVPPAFSPSHPPSAPAPGTAARPNTPVRMEMSACVLEPRFGAEDFVRVEFISRAGLTFLSPSTYAPGLEVRVAAPYTKDTENVFVPARIERVEPVPGKNLKRYAISFIRRQLP
ncbi:MAG TPA: hypothetical protein VJW51_12190 [Candidatus Acidoferrales bacterium]|nr:hypothetical protein [Candidatus Acidoferrales bacterium]